MDGFMMMDGFNIIFVFSSIFICVVFVFTFLMIFSPKLRAKMMGKQIKATKYMMDENKENLTDITTTAGNIFVQSGENILDENEDTLKDMATRTANISKDGIEITARAIRKGITEDELYCKHCGEVIDADSKFCKKCGKQQ